MKEGEHEGGRGRPIDYAYVTEGSGGKTYIVRYHMFHRHQGKEEVSGQ